MKKASHFTAALFFAILFCFGLWFWILPDREISYEENRPLQTLPELRLSELLSGDFSGELSAYYADQFPLRDAFVGLKSLAELSMGKGENDGILLGTGGQLARRLFRLPGFTSPTDAYDGEDLSRKTNVLKEFCQKAELPVAVLLPPRALDVASSAFSYPDTRGRAIFSQLEEELFGIGYRDLRGCLQDAYEKGESVWFKTDHHWTALGAYYAYAETMRAFGMEEEILPLNAFEKRVVSTSFFGTLASASGMKFIEPDEVELFLSGKEEEYEVTADGKELPGLYSFDALAKKDHYSIFLDGTHDLVTIRKKSGDARPVLLVAKDSFANSMAPFLALHFDLVFVNLSSTKREFCDLSSVIEKYQPQKLLVVYSVENLLTSDRLLNLR